MIKAVTRAAQCAQADSFCVDDVVVCFLTEVFKKGSFYFCQKQTTAAWMQKLWAYLRVCDFQRSVTVIFTSNSKKLTTGSIPNDINLIKSIGPISQPHKRRARCKILGLGLCL